MEKRVVRIFVILKILEGACLGFIATTYVPFLLERGLTLFQANQVNIAFMFVNMLLDPLTGSLADKIGQRKTYLSGFLFVGLGNLIYGVGHGFLFFVLAESIAAVGTALWSEALESWIRSLYGKEVSHKAIAKAGYSSRFFSVAFGFIGALAAARFGLHIPWFIGCAGAVVGVIAGFILTRGFPDPIKTSEEIRKGSLTDAFKLFAKVPELRFAAVVTCVSAMSYQALNMFWSPIFKELSGSVSWLGYIWAGVAVFTALGLRMIRDIHNPGKRIIGILTLLTGIPVFLSALFFGHNLLVLLAGFLMHEIGRGGAIPTIFTYSNDFIPDEIRSTSNSIRSSSRTVGAVLGLLISGFLTEIISPIQVWVLCGATLMLLSVWILFSGKNLR